MPIYIKASKRASGAVVYPNYILSVEITVEVIGYSLSVRITEGVTILIYYV